MKLAPAKEGVKYSITIASWNTVDRLARCIQSIFKHTENFEIIVVDNGSTDGSVGYLENLRGQHDNLRVIENGRNLNFGPAHNQAAEIAHGEYLIILNSDCIVTPEWAARLETCFNHQPDIGVVGPVTNNSNGRQMVGDVVANAKANVPLDLDGAAYFWGNQHAGQYAEAGLIYGWCMFMRRDWLADEPFLFDPRFTNSFEDNDLCLRMRLKGQRCFIDFSTFIWHEGQASFRASFTEAKQFVDHYNQNGIVNQRRFYEKYKPKDAQKLVAVYRIANCERYIRESMARTSEFADEIICLFARSQDRTKEIALTFPKVTVWEEWNEPEHPFDEQAERNWLLQKAIERGADWVISVDGDEVYEEKFIEMVPSLMRNPNPQVMAYICNWRTIWETDQNGVEKYRADSTFGGFQNYRFFKVLPGAAIKKNRNLYNHHCGSAPFFPPENQTWLNVRVKHLGYDTPEQRQWKYEFYRKADPRPVVEDVGTADYHHLIDKNVLLKTYREHNRISVMSVIKNEEANIFAMLQNVEPIADEFVIVDTGSTDNTLAEVERFAALTWRPVRIFKRTFECDENGMLLNYSEAKNWAKSRCRYEWVLNMDADEMFSAREVGNIFAYIDEDVDAFMFGVINYLEPVRGPKPEDNTWSISETIRLYRNIPELFYTGLVHESLEDAMAARVRNRKGFAIYAPIPMHHRGYLKAKEKVREKADRYHRINMRQFEVSGNADARPLFNMALHYANDGNTERMLEMYYRSLELCPEMWRAHQNLAFHYLSIAKGYLQKMQTLVPAQYRERNPKLAELCGVLDKFEFNVKKVC